MQLIEIVNAVTQVALVVIQALHPVVRFIVHVSCVFFFLDVCLVFWVSNPWP